MSKEVAEEYASSLADLTVNSKPLINMLTILAEENIDHAGVIVETVEKHLEKVAPEIKLPVLYLVDSIIKNVGGAYTQKFSQSIVNMFTRTFKQVDEKIRSQMFKLRETWHDVFPATKLYQLDVKVNLIDPAWPIQAQPQQSNIHVNPNFLKKNVPTTSAAPPIPEEDDKMRSILAKKEQELLMLQRKKIEMELEQTRRQLEMAEKNVKKVTTVMPPATAAMPVAMVNPVVPAVTVPIEQTVTMVPLPAKARLGPPVNKPTSVGRIAPVSGALAGARRDPRLARMRSNATPAIRPPPAPAVIPTVPPVVPVSVPVPILVPPISVSQPPPIASNVFDIKPLERVTKRKNVITFDVDPAAAAEVRTPRDPRRRRPDNRPDRPRRDRPRNRLDNGDQNDRKKDDKQEKRKPDDDKSLRKPDEEKLLRKPDEDKPLRKLDEDKPLRRLDEDKPLRKPDEDKPLRKIDEDKPMRKPDEDKLLRKPEEEKKRDDTRRSDSETETKKVEERPADRNSVDRYIDKLQIPDPKKINKLPPIPKINRDEPKEKETPSPVKRKKEPIRGDKKKKKETSKDNSSSSGSSPDKRPKTKENDRKAKPKEKRVEIEEKPPEMEVVAFKELKNYHKERYMRRNKEKSESPAPDIINEPEPPNVPEILETKDVDLRVLPAVEPKPAVIAQKRSSTEALEGKPKKNRLDKFDKLFGDEDVDLRQLPQVEELTVPPPPSISNSPKVDMNDEITPQISKALPMPIVPQIPITPQLPITQQMSPKIKDWHEIKEKTEEVKKTPSKLDLVRAKLAEATKGKDRLGRPLLFSKSPSIEKERRRTISSEDTDTRAEHTEDFDAEDHKKTISIIMNQAKEQYSDGKLDESQYNALMFQVLQLNEKLKLKEAKQRESLEISKRKLKAHIEEENHKVSLPKSSPNTFGDIDERVPPMFLDTPLDNQGFMQDSDMRVSMMDAMDGPPRGNMIPPPMFMGPFPNSNWRNQMRPRMDDFGPRRFRGPGPMPPFFRGKFDKRGIRPPFEARMPNMPMPQMLPAPLIGMCQGECPLKPYERCESPPPLGAPGVITPPTDFTIVEYIDQDPVKTIQIDGTPREIRFYGDTAIIMLDWDDPREIKFLPGCRRVTFDNKDSVVLSFNEPYKQVEIDDQVFDIRFGAPTRELYINGRWFECYFGGQPLGVLIDGKPRLVCLEGPLPQVDIGKTKRTDLVAGKINLIVNATQMCPVYLDAKVQKFTVNNRVFTLRFVDALRTVLINEQPFKVEYGDLPKPITIGNEKYFIRFSALPRNIKPGFVQLANMEGSNVPSIPRALAPPPAMPAVMDVDVEPQEPPRPPKTPSPERESHGLNMLASVMPIGMEAPASASAYSVAEPLFTKPENIPGLDTSGSTEEKPVTLPILGNINVNDLFAKLVATGIVPVPADAKAKEETKEEVTPKDKEEKSVIHEVDLLKPETLRVKQPGLVSRLYGGMQCSGCGTRFPPEHTVRYSQHLDWHFRQNRRERDSARRAHSRHWHYDLCDWLQYEELEDAEEREKSWFETSGETEAEAPATTVPAAAKSSTSVTSTLAPSVRAGPPAEAFCALCGDRFHQFYNEDTEEWHLRNSVKFEERNYHPLCLEDYKASLAKEEPPQAEQESTDEVVTIAVDKEEAIEIKDGDDVASQSDNDDVVEVVDTDPAPIEPVEIDEGDEDDVVLKQEPVVQVEVPDDEDTDDETTQERAKRDEQAAIDFAKIKVKQEPVDPDDEPIITAEEDPIIALVETNPHAHTQVLSSIDGNVQLEAAPVPTTTIPTGGIRINITKTLANTFINPPEDKSLEDISMDDEPLPPGEEPELEYKLKPSLEGVQLSRQPPMQKGNELSGLCSIM